MVFINDTTPLTIHSLQRGFHRGIGCMMSSLALNECLQFAREQDSKLYVNRFSIGYDMTGYLIN